MTEPATARRSKTGPMIVVFGYALPLVVAIGLLLLIKDWTIAIALICCEGATMTGIHLALRAPQPQHRRERRPGEPILGLPGDMPPGRSARDAKRVLAGMVGIILLLAGLSVLASHMS